MTQLTMGSDWFRVRENFSNETKNKFWKYKQIK